MGFAARAAFRIYPNKITAPRIVRGDKPRKRSTFPSVFRQPRIGGPKGEMTVGQARELQAGRVAAIREEQRTEREIGKPKAKQPWEMTPEKQKARLDWMRREAEAKRAPIERKPFVAPVGPERQPYITAPASATAGLLPPGGLGAYLPSEQEVGEQQRMEQAETEQAAGQRAWGVARPDLSPEEQAAMVAAGKTAPTPTKPAKPADWQRAEKEQQKIYKHARRLAEARGGTPADVGQASSDAQALLERYRAGDQTLQDSMHADMKAASFEGDLAAKTFLAILKGTPIPMKR